MSEKIWTLDEVWRLNLEQWKWISEQYQRYERQGKTAHPATVVVRLLKAQWVKDYGAEIAEDSCFFCAYDLQEGLAVDSAACEYCPGRLVDADFHCCRPEYAWDEKPVAFYQKLVELDTKRKGAKNVS